MKATYTVKRTNFRGEENYNKTFDTYRKAFNKVVRLQENSSKSSIIKLYENDRLMDEFTGLV